MSGLQQDLSDHDDVFSKENLKELADDTDAGQASMARDKALSTLNAWIAAEVLQPRRFRSIEDVVPEREDARLVQIVQKVKGRLTLPWEPDYPTPDYDEKRYKGFLGHQILLGAINMEAAMSRLFDVYGPDIERRDAGGFVPVATLDISHAGAIVPRSFRITSFAWAFPKVIAGDMSGLVNWGAVEGVMASTFDEQVGRQYLDVPLTVRGIQDINRWMVGALALESLRSSPPVPETDIYSTPKFVVSYLMRKPVERLDRRSGRKITRPAPQKPIEPLIMNSFYLDDLVDAHRLVEAGKAPDTLNRYLGITPPGEAPVDLIGDRAALLDLVQPDSSPDGCWPHPGGHPLVSLQQAAVNAACRADDGILGVNGPPGTGKTTLLKDIVANALVRRAEAMCRFDAPSKAFQPLRGGWLIERKGRQPTSHYGMCSIDPTITGHEIMVASNNNSAVENISKEWPVVEAVAAEAAASYLPKLGERLHEKPSWGAISAALGNKSNRSRFINRFWFDDHYGLRAHLGYVQGRQMSRFVEGKMESYVPDLVADHSPPRGVAAAQTAWLSERRVFLAILQEWREARSAAQNRYQDTRKETENLDHEAFNLSSPTFTAAENAIRARLFSQAMRVHKAFMEGAAAQFESNLSAAVSLLNGDRPSRPETSRAIFQSLFLVIPVISTTFASVSRMLAGLPENTIGTLIVDEAGQATPQSAVGAIMRAKKTVVVGDPVQVEPIMPLTDGLLTQIASTTNVDVGEVLPPVTSVQNFADRVSHFQSVFPSMSGSRQVGLPLLVHRRCDRLMFDVSNQVGYGGLMVYGTAERPKSAIETVLGPSAWFDVEDTAGNNKWSAKEGQVAIDLLKKLRDADISLSEVFLVSPFRDVAFGLRRMILHNSGALGFRGEENARKFMREQVGTVHTVQGRENTAVLLVLGAQGAGRRGARNWAGAHPNILNVAVTRARRWLGVIGNRSDWATSGCFRVLEQAITTPQPEQAADDLEAEPGGAGRQEKSARLPRP